MKDSCYSVITTWLYSRILSEKNTDDDPRVKSIIYCELINNWKKSNVNTKIQNKCLIVSQQMNAFDEVLFA